MTRERWLERVAASGDEIHTLESNDQCWLFIIYDRASKGDPFGREPTYSVWFGNEWSYCGQNRAKAYSTYHEVIQRIDSKCLE